MKNAFCLLIGLMMSMSWYTPRAIADQPIDILIPDRQATVSHQAVESGQETAADTHTVLVSALGPDGKPIRGLGPSDFKIRSATKEAKILSVEPLETSKNISLNIVLVIDNSYSMKERQAVEPLLTALEEFLNIVRPIDNIEVIVFDKEGTRRAGPYTLRTRTFKSNDPDALRAFFRRSFDEKLSDKTYLFEGILAGLQEIRNMPASENKFMVIFSDGEDINSAFESGVVAEAAQGMRNFEVYSVDYMPVSTLDKFLQSFALNHGGRIWKARSAEELLPIFKSFSTTLLYRYAITYRFLNPPSGKVAMLPDRLDFRMLTLKDGSPLGPYVFFNSGQSDIPRAYHLFSQSADTAAFNPQQLQTAEQRYLHILNIVGHRLRNEPTAWVQITGYRAADPAEAAEPQLAERRARKVQDYLQTIWRIDSDRIRVSSGTLPPHPSDAGLPGGSSENRRVELQIQTATGPLLGPDTFIVETRDIDAVQILPDIQAEYGLATWQIQLTGDGRPLETLQGSGPLATGYQIPLNALGRQRLAGVDSLQARISVSDTNNDTLTVTSAAIPVQVSKKVLIDDLIRPLNASLTLEPRRITIEEVTTIDSSPMLNYIFFDTGESMIPQRYALLSSQSEVRAFSESELKGTMDKYAQVLNIIGNRMQNHPDALIEIVGCNSNYGEERGRKDLSRSRAEAVQSYLRYVWGIDPARMPVKVRNLPAIPSSSRVPEGRAENQRAEIHSDHPAILDTVKSTYVTETSDTEILRATPVVSGGYALSDWKLELTGDGTAIYRWEGRGRPEVSYQLALREIGLQQLSTYENLGGVVQATDQNGNTVRTAAPSSNIRFIRREQRMAQKQGYKVLEKYALILFDFDSAEIKSRNRIVVDRIVDRLKQIPEARVSVVGHTDTIGSEAYNLKLSERRAKAVYDQLVAAGLAQSETVSFKGIGPYDPLYDNALPEGRSFNRTVTVNLEYERRQ